MNSINTLNEVDLDKEVKIKTINCSPNIKKRILDLGIIEGTKIKPVLRSPLGDPTAYEVRGSIISLREEESKKIYVFKEKNKRDEEF